MADQAESELTAPGGSPNNYALWIVWGVGLIGAIASVISFATVFTGGLTAGYVLTIVIVQLVVLSAIIAYLQRVFSGNIRVLSNSVQSLHHQVGVAQQSQRAVSGILTLARDLNAEIAGLRAIPNEAELITFSRGAVRQLARTFTESLGFQCRVCVKQVHLSDGTRPWAEAIARSDKSIEGDIGVPHYLDSNTDFSQLHRSQTPVWFCNDILRYPNYRTTSNMPRYRSTIVWPVLTRVAENATPRDGFAPVVAFLCLDSEVPDAFTPDDHIPMGWAVSDALARAYEAHRSIWLP